MAAAAEQHLPLPRPCTPFDDSGSGVARHEVLPIGAVGAVAGEDLRGGPAAYPVHGGQNVDVADNSPRQPRGAPSALSRDAHASTVTTSA